MDDHDYADKFYELQRRGRSRRTVEFFLRTYSLLGVLLATVAGGYFLLTLLSFELSDEQRLALMFAGGGVLISLMSRILITFYKERDEKVLAREEEYESLAFFLDAWTHFEHVGKEVLSESENDIHSLRLMISRLYEEGKIDKEDIAILHDGLRTRNLIVHGNRAISTRVSDRVTESLGEVTRKIRTRA